MAATKLIEAIRRVCGYDRASGITTPTSTSESTVGGAAVTMRQGAIGIIDVLGFKGIWRRYTEERVIRSMQALLVSTTMDAIEQVAGGSNTMTDFIAPVFLSDTVVFGLAPLPVDEANRRLEATGEAELIGTVDAYTLDSWCAWHMGNLLASLMRRALVGDVPLAFRGAIAFGRFGMTDRFIIGEAVDEAADYHERADAAIVGLAPSAQRYEQAEVPSQVSKFVKYDIPVKPMGTDLRPPWQTWAVVPWADVGDETVEPGLEDLYSRTLVTNERSLVDAVERKRRNTLAFLHFAAEAHATPMRELLQDLADIAQNVAGAIPKGGRT